MPVRIRLTPGAAARRGHPWVRRKEASRVMGPPDPWALAEISDHRGRVVGWGTYAPDGPIVARVIWRGAEPPPADWLRRGIRASVARRDDLAALHTGYREVNGAGDDLPGLVIDRFGEIRVVQVTTAAMAVRIDAIHEALDQSSIVVLRPEGAAGREGFEPGATVRLESGEDSLDALRFSEHGIDFTVPAPPSQKTGAYHDQRENRRRMASLAATVDGPLLDVGCHAGGFLLHAARAGIAAVGLDSSRTMLRCAAANAAALRAKHPDAADCTFVRADMFAPLSDARLDGPFGTIVFDPPKVASGKRQLDQAERAMSRVIHQLAMRLCEGGILAVCSCSHALDAARLDAIVERVAATGGRALDPIAGARWGPGVDHPVHPNHPEGDYLCVNAYRFGGSR